MSLRRRLTLGFGLLAAIAGLAFVVEPEFASQVGGSRLEVVIVGLFALVQGVRVIAARSERRIEMAETGVPEDVPSMPVPGVEFDELLGRARGRTLSSRRGRKEVRERLRTAAIDALVWKERCTRSEAESLLEAGTWTDDPHAAALLGGPSASDWSPLELARIALSRESQFERGARRAAAEISRIVEGGAE